MTNNKVSAARLAANAFLDGRTGRFGPFHVDKDKVFTFSIGKANPDDLVVTWFPSIIAIKDADGIHMDPLAPIGHRRVRKFLRFLGIDMD